MPSQEEVKNLKIKDLVLLGFEQKGKLLERLYVRITNIQSDGTFEGQVESEIQQLTNIKNGNIVAFEAKHIWLISDVSPSLGWKN